MLVLFFFFFYHFLLRNHLLLEKLITVEKLNLLGCRDWSTMKNDAKHNQGKLWIIDIPTCSAAEFSTTVQFNIDEEKHPLAFIFMQSLSVLNDDCKCSWKQPDDLSAHGHLFVKAQFLSKNVNSRGTNKELKPLYTLGAPLYDTQIIAVSVCSCMIF